MHDSKTFNNVFYALKEDLIYATEFEIQEMVKNRSRIGINKWYQSFALRNFDLEDMELEYTNSGPTAKLPILKLGEYEMWAIRIKHYFQIQDYAHWEVIENDVYTCNCRREDKEKNDVKAKGLLLMALPNEHQLTFSQYPDAKSMFAAIETRFGGNAATKKTQKTLLKQQYENFSATSVESLDSIFYRLQKIVSRLAILGVIVAQKDLNLKFLSSLPPEWNTHVVVWTNKPKIETMSIDDLYNNFKIFEQKIKKTIGTSSGGQNLAFMTAPSSSSTNDANTAYSQVSVDSLSVNTASPQVCTASVSDNTVYAFMVENPNGSNVLHQRFGINKWYQSFALRNFDLEDMELESTNSGPTAKLSILKLGEYEMWAIRIKQYFHIQDYALWEVIENGDSWVPISQTTEENGITTLKMYTPATAEEKIKKKNDVKARGLLLMALPNKHQVTFSQYPNAKSMFAAIETRFGGNATTKKTRKTLLKQQYENFSATSAESFDSIFNRLQKIMNKPEIETMSIDDLYNNFKIVEQKIKKTVGTSSGGQNLAFMTAPSSSSINDANTAYSQLCC
ncbi:hypothetical protein Tco_1083071 [Tanacetum coccineum]|uniref:Uncharacterized protein n=1 Tax=Tanacetum coccineum TaxID=301880 RepID=A0ABQ5I3E1_9ASTR